MITLNIIPELILYVSLFFIAFWVLLSFFDKKNKPKRDEYNMLAMTAWILNNRFINEIGDITKNRKNLCKDMLSDIYYVINLFYRDTYGFYNKSVFLIKSSKRKEKLKKEFSEIYEKIIAEDVDSITTPESNITVKEITLNVMETNELINSFKDDNDWSDELTRFWQIIYVCIGSRINN